MTFVEGVRMFNKSVPVLMFDDLGSIVHLFYGLVAGVFLKYGYTKIYAFMFVVFLLYQLVTHIWKPREHQEHRVLGDLSEFFWGVAWGAVLG